MRPCSPDALRLRELAIRFAAAELPGVPCALTGSAGRGDASPWSDLDLWAVTGAAREVSRTSFEGVPVTVFREPEALLRDPSHLIHVEVLNAWALPGWEAAFAPARTIATAHRELWVREREAAVRQTAGVLLGQTAAGTLEGRLWCAREVVRRMTSVEAHRATGTLAPKVRHFQAALSPARFAEVIAALGLAQVAARHPSLLEEAEAATEALNQVRASLSLEPVSLPPPLLRKWGSPETFDAVLGLRRWLHTQLVEPLQRQSPGMNVVGWLDERAPPAVAALWRAAHGFDPPPTEPELARAVALARELLGR